MLLHNTIKVTIRDGMEITTGKYLALAVNFSDIVSLPRNSQNLIDRWSLAILAPSIKAVVRNVRMSRGAGSKYMPYGWVSIGNVPYRIGGDYGIEGRPLYAESQVYAGMKVAIPEDLKKDFWLSLLSNRIADHVSVRMRMEDFAVNNLRNLSQSVRPK